MTSSWHSVWERSRASSSPRWVGLPPTITAPASAAAPIQKTNSGTLSSMRATWKGPGRRREARTAARSAWAVTTWSWVQVRSPKASPAPWSPARRRISSSMVCMASPWLCRSCLAVRPTVGGVARPGKGQAQIWNTLQFIKSPCTVKPRQCGARGVPPRWSLESFSTATCLARPLTTRRASTRCSGVRWPTSSRRTSTTGSTPGWASTTR